MNEPSAFLTLPKSGQTPPMKALTRKVRLLALRTLMTQGQLDGPVGATLGALQRQLRALLKDNAATVISSIGRPEVLVPLLVLRAGLQSAMDVFTPMLPHLLCALPVNPPLLWDHPVGQLLTADASYTFDPPCRAMVSDVSGVELETANGTRLHLSKMAKDPRGWPLSGGIELSAVDTNPVRMHEAHPEKTGNSLSLGGRDPEHWQHALNEALAVIEQTLPTFYAALPHTLQRIVPVGFEPELHFSASYREAPGTIYMTLHPSVLTLAEAIVHEVQHGKLNTLSWFDPVLHNAMSEWTTSPVRPDLRPIWGVLLAVHAFVPVALMHQRLADSGHALSKRTGFQARREEVVASNARGMATVLEKGQPTTLGQRVIEGLVGMM